MAMIKHVFSLTKPQTEYIEQKARQLGISTAELVRRILDEYRFRETAESAMSENDEDVVKDN